jgi:hypothetical protein
VSGSRDNPFSAMSDRLAVTRDLRETLPKADAQSFLITYPTDISYSFLIVRRLTSFIRGNMTMRTAPQALPTDVRALVNQTIDSLRELMPPTPSFVSDEIKQAVFKEVDTIASDMRTLNLAIHGEC